MEKATIEIGINGLYTITQEGFEQLIEIFGQPDEELSNCCYADVYPHNADDHTSRCRDCGEGCSVVYNWTEK
jgi:hypothetical protein